MTISRDVAPAPVLPQAAEELIVVPARHPWRWAVTAVVAVLLAMAINALVTNPAWDWPTVGQFLFAPSILRSVVLTLQLTVLGIVVGFVLGTVLAVMRMSPNPLLRSVSWAYIWIFRSVPLIRPEPKDVAGLTISVSSGTNQEEILVGWDEQNRAAGLAPVNFQYYQSTGDYYLALDSGRIDAYFGPNPTLTYHAAVGGTTKIVGSVSGGGNVTADIAAMTRKDNGLVRALNEALNTVIQNGRYAEVLDRWKLTSEAVPTSQVNPPGLPRKPAS